MSFDPKQIYKTPDPYKTPGIKFIKPVMFKYGILGSKVWVKTVKNGKLCYRFDAVYFEPPELLEGAEKRRLRWMVRNCG